MEQRRIKLKDIAQNTGQIDGLPSNPRTWTREELDRLKKSIEETPELLEARGIIVYPHNGQFVAMGGNMRLAALGEMGAKDAPCIVLDADTSLDKLKEIVIKDNGKFGENDWDKLANEWSDCPLTDWGTPVWDADAAEGEEGGGESDNNYSRKIEVPSYTPSGEHPQLSECYNVDKRNDLVREIEASDIPEDVKSFLVSAANRHIEFYYDKIADYYTSAPKEIQELMEKSALVIIDWGGAIDNGFIKMAKRIAEQYDRDYDGK